MQWELSLEQLDDFAHDFWKHTGGDRIFLFYGEMGAGKTTIITALCRSLGVQDGVSSPTFSIINQYAGAAGQPVYHMDLYRLKDAEEAYQAGVADCLGSGCICFVEWPEKAPQLFEAADVRVSITALENGRRQVQLSLS